MIPPLFSATLTTIAVFIPMILLDGVSGFFFKASSTTIAIALTLSLLLAIFFIPIMVFHSFGKNRPPCHEIQKPGIFQRTYEIFLGAVLNRSGIIVLFSTLMAFAAVVMFFKLPISFLPTWDEGTFIMGAPGKAGNFLSVKVRHSQRLATGLSPKVHLWR